MKKFWGYMSAFLGGLATAFIFVWLTVRNKISNNTINIRRPKIKDSEESSQDFTSQIIAATKKAERTNKKELRKQRRKEKKSK